MSNLLGVWSLNGERIDALLTESHKSLLLTQLSKPLKKLQCLSAKRLWLVAEKNQCVDNHNGCVALEGYLPKSISIKAILSQWLAKPKHHWRDTPSGHFSLVHLSAKGESLTLLRSLSGGERIYLKRQNGLLFFSSCIRPLLALENQTRQFNENKYQEILLAGLTLFGSETLVSGIEEVQAGQTLCFEVDQVNQAFHWQGLLEPLRGDVNQLATAFHDKLTHAVEQSIGDDAQVAIALSGGIDSAAIIASAVEVKGAANVVAYTYEFDDPTHPKETEYAQAVCKRLGVKQHQIIKIRFSDFLGAIPETVWRSENFLHWPKSFMLSVSRAIKADGFDQYLSGFGVGSHMTYFEELANAIQRYPAMARVAKIWSFNQFSRRFWLTSLERLHPSLAMPNRRLYYLLLCLLKFKGYINGLEPYYPKDAKQFILKAKSMPAADGVFADMSLVELFRHQSFAHLISCVDVTRWEKVMREIGINRVSPAHFSECLPYAYLPVLPRPGLYDSDRQLRPGKHLLRLGYRQQLPDCVLYRKKSWADAVISPTWLKAGERWMQAACGGSSPLFQHFDQDYLDDWNKRSPQAIVTGLKFWHKLFIEMPPSDQPPTWQNLGACGHRGI